MKSIAWIAFIIAVNCAPLAARAQTGPEDLAVNRIRFFPAAHHENEMVGGKFLGSNGLDLPTIWLQSSRIHDLGGFTALVEIKAAPAAGQWTELAFPNATTYRWLIYVGPPGSHGRVAEIEFYAGTKKLSGARTSSFPNGGPTSYPAMDGRTDTSYEGADPDDQYSGLDLGFQATGPGPSLDPSPGEFDRPQTVTLGANLPGIPIRFTLDGTIPMAGNGQDYSKPIIVGRTTTICAVAYKKGLAPTKPVYGTYRAGGARPRTLLQIGNSLTWVGSSFGEQAAAAGDPFNQQMFQLGGALTKKLWNASQGAGAPSDKERWDKMWANLARIDDFTLQPRDFDLAEEAGYDNRFLNLVGQKSPGFRPWLYVEWTEMNRKRPTDLGTEPTDEMKKTWPAGTWEESMAAMVLYGEDLKRRIDEAYRGKQPIRIIPVALAMGWLHHAIESGEFPGVGPGQFHSLLFHDGVHTNAEGSFLVGCSWYAALTGKSPEGRFLPVRTNLTHAQARAMQRLAWDAVKNYPYSGLYEEGSTPAGRPTILPAGGPIQAALRATLSSSTPGAWFRYTLDGTPPTRKNGYIYCGVITVRPGMTVKAISYKSGMADSSVAEATFQG